MLVVEMAIHNVENGVVVLFPLGIHRDNLREAWQRPIVSQVILVASARYVILDIRVATCQAFVE